MNIKPDFNHNIIISAQGLTQIKLLYLIYENLNKNYNYRSLLNEQAKGTLCLVDNLLAEETKPEILYGHNMNNSISCNRGTVFTRRKLEKYYALNRNESIKGDYYLENMHEKYNLKNYKLIYMKEFLKLYGKYLFINEDYRNDFVKNYPELEISPIMQIIKQITF